MLKKIFTWLFDFAKTLLLTLAIFWIIFNFLIYPCQVEGRSMQPTLYDGDLGFSFICTKINGIQRFNIVIIESDKSDNLLVKRVIGLPNETIEFKDNELYVNGELVDQYFLSDDVITEDFVYELKDDEYFCMGDNRQNSRDSRYYGPFSESNFIAENMFIFKPLSSFGIKK